MAEIVPITDAADYVAVHRRIKKFWTQGQVLISTHAQDRMDGRKIGILDVEHVIKYGSVVDHSKPGELWRYTVRGTLVDGGGIDCVVEINGRLILVTLIRHSR